MTTLATRNTQDTTTEGTLFVAFALSLRVIMPHAYTDKGQLTPHVHRQYVARFPDRWSRGAVLWTLAQALLGSSRY